MNKALIVVKLIFSGARFIRAVCVVFVRMALMKFYEVRLERILKKLPDDELKEEIIANARKCDAAVKIAVRKSLMNIRRI